MKSRTSCSFWIGVSRSYETIVCGERVAGEITGVSDGVQWSRRAYCAKHLQGWGEAALSAGMTITIHSLGGRYDPEDSGV